MNIVQALDLPFPSVVIIADGHLLLFELRLLFWSPDHMLMSEPSLTHQPSRPQPDAAAM